ncbi:MAG: rod shape-determining protein MreD [Candidatus Thioglobus sp.]|jgi:rod shape-determining protein MreD|uniref:Rod shape-determining protein MreD n=1 Tax=hydrothermal vent metagenome TaxID=652676 RepID=A0A1W1DBW5_9ZZZZ
MKTQRPYIFLTKITFFALIISALPLSQTVLEASPFWLLLFFIYWLTYFPAKAQFFLALLLGVLLDILQGDTLGQNALALILSSAFIVNVKQSFFVSNLSTQQVYVFVASSIYLGLFLLVHTLIQGFNFSYYLLFAPLTGALFWPLVKLALSKFKHQ